MTNIIERKCSDAEARVEMVVFVHIIKQTRENYINNKLVNNHQQKSVDKLNSRNVIEAYNTEESDDAYYNLSLYPENMLFGYRRMRTIIHRDSNPNMQLDKETGCGDREIVATVIMDCPIGGSTAYRVRLRYEFTWGFHSITSREYDVVDLSYGVVRSYDEMVNEKLFLEQ